MLMAAASPSPSTCTSRSRWCALLPAPRAAGVCDSQGTSTDSQLTVAGSVSAELGISEGVVCRDGAGDLEKTEDLEQINSQETHVVSDSRQYLLDAGLSTISLSQSPVLLR